jgi:hypothetical protein
VLRVNKLLLQGELNGSRKGAHVRAPNKQQHKEEREMRAKVDGAAAAKKIASRSTEEQLRVAFDEKVPRVLMCDKCKSAFTGSKKALDKKCKINKG